MSESEQVFVRWMYKLEREVEEFRSRIKGAKRKDIPSLIKELDTQKAFLEHLNDYVEKYKLGNRTYYRRLDDIERELGKASKKIAKKKKPSWVRLLNALSKIHKRFAKIFEYWQFLEKIPLLKGISERVSDFIDFLAKIIYQLTGLKEQGLLTSGNED